MGVRAATARRLAFGCEPALKERLTDERRAPIRGACDSARRAMERLAAMKARAIALTDSEYPQELCDLSDPPPLLFARGQRISRGGTAIVGTRTPTEAGRWMAGALAKELAPPVVSGLARGVDAAAHRGALEAGVATIAYVGNGLGATYPPEHRDLEEAIVHGGGTIVSERLPGEPVARCSLVRRDRLQAAHADRTVLVETESSGGAMHTMRFAASLRRERFAFSSRPSDAKTTGNAVAIADGAVPLVWDLRVALRAIGGAREAL